MVDDLTDFSTLDKISVYRNDIENMDHILEDVVIQFPLFWAITDGWPFDCFSPLVNNSNPSLANEFLKTLLISS